MNFSAKRNIFCNMKNSFVVQTRHNWEGIIHFWEYHADGLSKKKPWGCRCHVSSFSSSHFQPIGALLVYPRPTIVYPVIQRQNKIETQNKGGENCRFISISESYTLVRNYHTYYSTEQSRLLITALQAEIDIQTWHIFPNVKVTPNRNVHYF